MNRKNFENYDNVKVRLLEFAEKQGIPKILFYEKISVASSNFSGKSAVSSLSATKIAEILTIYKELSPDWLLLGSGPMLRQNETQVATIPSNIPDPTALALIKRNEELVQEITLLRTEIERLKKATHTQILETADISM